MAGADRPDIDRLYGRRRGPRLRAGRQALMDRLLPELQIDVPAESAPGAPGAIDPRALFAAPVEDFWLEIGFGGGEHLAAQAAAHPDIGLIGCEPFVNGVARLIARIDEAGLANIRLHPDDARPLIAALPDACLGRVFILFPDPWPKARHHKRRLVTTALLDALARVMADGAELRLATDHGGYARWMLARLIAHPAFAWTARRPGDWRDRPPDWPATRYETKAQARGQPGIFMRFQRRARA